MNGKVIGGAILFGLLACLGCDARTSPSAVRVAAGAEKSTAGKEAEGEGHAEATPVKVKVFNKSAQLVSVEQPKVVKSDEEWQKLLTREQYLVSRGKGTEPPFCGNLLDNKKEGVYACIGCSLPLFSSDSKFNSGTGWPSFFQPVAAENVIEHADHSHGMVRTEILCARCDGHLGHVFDDGPRPTGLRFCVNSESLKFVPKEKLATLADPSAGDEAPGASPASKPSAEKAK